MCRVVVGAKTLRLWEFELRESKETVMASPAYDEHMKAECQRYLASFRVTELKELLKVCGQSQRGRKPELFQRANDMLQFGTPKFQNKIREIYERTRQTRRHQRRQSPKTSPIKSAGLANKSPSHAYIVHPDVKFKNHPFFSKMDTIIRPTALMSTGMSSLGALSMKITFHLTPQQIHQIYISKTSTGSYQVQVLVRFCLQETTCEQNDLFPKQCYVKVNSHHCPLPGYHPQLSTRPDYKRTGQPVNITNFVKTSPTEANEVMIYWSHDIMLPQGYCVGVDIAKSISAPELLQALKEKGVRSPDMSRALVKDKFKVDSDSEISATSLKVSLLCPIGKMRMSYPCRTTQCNHLQCFDASIYYQMNEKKARWVCPVCDKEALPQDLFIDGLFMEICQQCPSSSNHIEFSADGSWLPASDKTGPSLTVSIPEKRGNSPISVDTPESKKQGPVVIDLTVSSDEEDEAEEREREEEEEEDEEEEEGVLQLTHRLRRRVSVESTPSDSESTISSSSSTTLASYSPSLPPTSLPDASSQNSSSSSSSHPYHSSLPPSSLITPYEAPSLPTVLHPPPNKTTVSSTCHQMSVISRALPSSQSNTHVLSNSRGESASVPSGGLGPALAPYHLSHNGMYPIVGDALLTSSFLPVPMDKNLLSLFSARFLSVTPTTSSKAGIPPD